jgi:hypothetical protein
MNTDPLAHKINIVCVFVGQQRWAKYARMPVCPQMRLHPMSNQEGSFRVATMVLTRHVDLMR